MRTLRTKWIGTLLPACWTPVAVEDKTWSVIKRMYQDLPTEESGEQ